MVYLPTWIEWDSMRQRPQYLLAAFAAAGHPVFLVDPRVDSERQVDGVEIVPSIADVPGTGVILYVHFAPVADEFSKFEDAIVVYDILDDLSIYDRDEEGLPEHRRVRAHHPLVMERADVVIASSVALVERHRHERDDILLVENGVDHARFAASAARPPDMGFESPIIGYHGALAPWIDFGAIEAVARRRPEWSLVFVGPIDPAVRPDVDRLRSLGNVHILGERPSDSMPAYVQAFDVGVIWFVVDELTRAVSPLKLYEYLAAGTPAVSAPLPACIGVEGVRIAEGPDGYEEMIEAALGTAPDRTPADASRFGWSARVEPVIAELDRIEGRRVRS